MTKTEQKKAIETAERALHGLTLDIQAAEMLLEDAEESWDHFTANIAAQSFAETAIAASEVILKLYRPFTNPDGLSFTTTFAVEKSADATALSAKKCSTSHPSQIHPQAKNTLALAQKTLTAAKAALLAAKPPA
ncbi:MAG: hypothetical protein LBS59_01010 [Puniceicoccales bacterium]|jgi:hypothetical protein|nr:hypothetical protein [Puniceicoccales bacterium]